MSTLTINAGVPTSDEVPDDAVDLLRLLHMNMPSGVLHQPDVGVLQVRQAAVHGVHRQRAVPPTEHQQSGHGETLPGHAEVGRGEQTPLVV